MEDLTTFMCVADNGTVAATGCGEWQRDEMEPLELAHNWRFFILARESDFRDFLFVQLVAMARSINTRDKPRTEQLSFLLWNTEEMKRVDCTVSAHEILNMVWLTEWKDFVWEVFRLTTRGSALCSYDQG